MSEVYIPLEGPLPEIAMSEAAYRILSEMQGRLPERLSHVAELLGQELDRAHVMPEETLPQDAVRLNSTARLQFGGSSEIQVFKLVYPEDADFSAGRLSVLSLAGAALIGLFPAAPMFWRSLTGTPCSVMVHEILRHS